MASEKFLEQFSKTLSAAKHPSTRQNTATARRLPQKLPDALAHTVFPVGRPYPTAPAALRRPLRRPLPLPAPLTLRIGNKEDKVSTHRLKPCTDPAVPPAKPRTRGRRRSARCRPLSGFSRAWHFGDPQGTFCPATCKGTAPGTVFPWPAARGFCTPSRRSRSARTRPPSTKQTRPLDLRP
jgi:hypothetical protein